MIEEKLLNKKIILNIFSLIVKNNSIKVIINIWECGTIQLKDAI